MTSTPVPDPGEEMPGGPDAPQGVDLPEGDRLTIIDHSGVQALPGYLMLVSANADAEARREVATGRRPRPEYLVLEKDHGVQLLDWGALRRPPSRRRAGGSLVHAGSALLRSRASAAILSDGEHVGLPLAAALALKRRRPGHVVIAHHLTTPAKRRLLSIPGVTRGVDAFVVHSQAQVEILVGEMGLPQEKVHLLPYGVDTQFWCPQDLGEEQLVMSPGREHRDYIALADAVVGLDARVFVTDGSSHSPSAQRRIPSEWPKNIERGSLGLHELREMYARAAIVVVPLVETDFPAGITVVVEAMSMGKAVVVTGTEGLRGALADPEAVVTVAPRDAKGLRGAIVELLADPARRSELGQRAQRAAVVHHDVAIFATALKAMLEGTEGAR